MTEVASRIGAPHRVSERRHAFATVFKMEWMLMRAERGIVGVALFLALAAVYAGIEGRSWSTGQTATRQAIEQDAVRQTKLLRHQLDSLANVRRPPAAFGDPRNPYTAGTRSARQYATLPPSPLAPAAIGQADLMSSYHRVSMISSETFFVNEEIDNPINLLAGRFDLAFFTVMLYPLVILAMSYNTLSADRESGTLGMLLAQPVTMRDLLAAKIAARATAGLGLSIVVSVIGLVVAGVDLGAPGAASRVALWILIVAAYGALWFAAALAVNVAPRSSGTNALILLAAWLAATVLLPSSVNLVATVRYPVPSRVALIQATRDASNAAAARGSQLLGLYYQDHPELMPGGVPASDFGTRTIAVQDEVDRMITPLTRQFETQLDRQEALARSWRFASPALLAHDALTTLAGTSTERFRDYERQVGAYRTGLHDFFTPLVVHGEAFTTDRLGSVPRFAYREEDTARVVRQALVAVVALMVATVVVTLVVLRLDR